MGAMIEYNLYIDESGEFRGRARSSVVCGVLEDTSARVDWQAFRQCLHEVLPLVPYPFHATLLHEPALWVALVMLQRGVGGATTSASPAIEEVLRVVEPAVEVLRRLTRSERAPIARFSQALRDGQLPDRLALVSCSALLKRRDAHIYRALEALRDRMRYRLEACCVRMLKRSQDDLVAIAAVADGNARESEVDDFISDSLTSVRRDAYVRALETLFERVLCLLRGGGGCRVNVWVATRHVQLRGYGPLALGVESVREIAAAAARLPALPSTTGTATSDGKRGGQVAFEVLRGIVPYDASAPMGLVLADYVSNRLWHALAHSAGDLTRLNQLLEQRVGLRCEGAPRHPLATALMSSLAWDGEARRRVLCAYGREPSAADDLSPAANRAQAGQWIGFASHVWEALGR